MSRDVLASHAGLDDADDDGSAAARRARTWRIGVAVGMVAIAAAAVVAVGHAGGDRASHDAAPDGDRLHRPGPAPFDGASPVFPVGEGLVGHLEVRRRSGRGSTAPLDIDRLYAYVVVSNAMPQPRGVLDVIVNGLGTTIVDVPPRELRLPPGGSARLSATVIPDCTALARRQWQVLVNQQYDGEDAQVEQLTFDTAEPDPAAVLAPLCPPSEPGLRVVATTAQIPEDSVALVRLVNVGRFAAQIAVTGASTTGLEVTTDPSPPGDLASGQSLLLRLHVQARRCTASPGSGAGPGSGTGAIGLEARTPMGYAAVIDARAALWQGPGLTQALRTASTQAARDACHG